MKTTYTVTLTNTHTGSRFVFDCESKPEALRIAHAVYCTAYATSVLLYAPPPTSGECAYPPESPLVQELLAKHFEIECLPRGFFVAIGKR